MKLNQSFVVDSPLPTVWQAFQKPEQLVGCLPGAELGESASADDLALTLKVKLGPISVRFVGNGQITFNEAQHEGVFQGQAADTKNNSRVKGIANFHLTENGQDRTEVSVAIDFTITGTLAQFSRENIVRSVADQLTRDFANNLQNRLQSDIVEPTNASTTTTTTTSSTHSPSCSASAANKSASDASASSAPALSVTALIWRTFTHWLRQVVRGDRS